VLLAWRGGVVRGSADVAPAGRLTAVPASDRGDAPRTWGLEAGPASRIVVCRWILTRIDPTSALAIHQLAPGRVARRLDIPHGNRILGAVVTKRLIDVDDDVLEAAKRVLGTATIKDTVNSALRASVQAAERRQRLDAAALQRFAEASRDLRDEDVMADAWR
jgi:Arc/MetJ family transcription regulator